MFQCQNFFIFVTDALECLFGRHDTQHNDTQHDDTQHDDTQHDDTQHDDTQHDNQHNNILNATHNGRVLLC
jgi:hypothetical protein